MTDENFAPPVSSQVLSLFRAVMYATLTVVALPIQAIAVARRAEFRRRFPVFYHRLVLRALGIRLAVHGTRSETRPTLFVSNHISYLDIEVLGSILPASFIAKDDVRGWPLFGWLARLQESVFVDRRARSTQIQREQIESRLAAGDHLVLFPEGTSSDGNHLRPFRSALFSAAESQVEGVPVRIQPVTIAYCRLNGAPLGRGLRPMLAWYGDMELAGHLWDLIGLGAVEATVQFHQPVTIDMFGTRKALAAHCQRVIADALAAANAGRVDPSSAYDGTAFLAAGDALVPA